MTTVAFQADQLFFSAPGGIGTYIRELVPAMMQADPSLDLTLFHATFPQGTPEAWMHTLPLQSLPHPISRLYPLWDTVGRPSLPAGLAGLDVLHAPSCAGLPPAGRRQRLVVTVHDLAFKLHPKLYPPAWRNLFRLGLRRAARLADAIITVSRNTAEDLVQETNVDPSRVHVIPLAAWLPSTEEPVEPVLERLKVTRPYFLFVGTLEPRKNLVRLVRAYRRAAGTGLPHSLVLAGPMGWGGQALMRELTLAGPGNVVLTGRAEHPELDALYRGASAFVYPSIYEGFGLPVLEAMSRGVPTVTSNVSSLPEVAGDAALLVEPRSVPDLAEAMTRAVEPDTAERLRADGLARAERFSWAETARLTLEVYEKR
ncbi:MAG: glycosyltransferase family 4 protein [Actinobacteria bacterium]|nr:glycosyltransferase family 4 protein [Actinomycetota bacterium]